LKKWNKLARFISSESVVGNVELNIIAGGCSARKVLVLVSNYGCPGALGARKVLGLRNQLLQLGQECLALVVRL
jgi:hypothetical protein